MRPMRQRSQPVGIAMQFKPASARKTAGRLLSYITGGYKVQFFLVLVCILASVIAGVTGSLFLKRLIDSYITPLISSPHPDFSGLAGALSVMAAIYAGGIIATYIYNRLMIVIAQGILKTIRDNTFARMQRLPVRFFDTHSHGDIMSYYTNDIDTLRQMLSQSIPQIFSSLVTILAVFIAMIVTSVHLTLLVILMMAGMILIARTIGGKSSSYFGKQQASLGKVNGYIEEMVNGQKVIKVFCHEEKAKERFDELNDELAVYATKANIYANIFMPIMANFGTLQYILIAIVGGALATGNGTTLTLGAIATFLQLSRTFSMPVSQVSQQINSVLMALAGAERVFALMDETPETDEGTVTLVNATPTGPLTETDATTGVWAWKHPHQDGTVTYTRLQGDVRFDGVTFGYKTNESVLHNISLYAKPAQKVAFVGATGAGKTTITNLINRFYDISDGEIHYDGIPITRIKKSDLRRSLGMVLQDTHLFTGTVMDNIRYGNLDASDEDVHEAARRANADGFISRLPNGYQTELTSDGESLSQGQRQLIAIARAAVANPPVLILDEATSSIDTRTETIVQQGMDALMEGRTVFVIAHRLSTVHNANVIMVLEHGRIIERGTHEQLISLRGKYYQLYTGAFELE